MEKYHTAVAPAPYQGDRGLRYRSAAFFSRLYCPEVTMGMQSEDELIDSDLPSKPSTPPEMSADPLNMATENDKDNTQLSGSTFPLPFQRRGNI